MTKKYPSYQHVHFVGIGGAGMSGIAEVLLNLGYKVSGSDIRESDTTRRLESLGASIFIGHRKENIRGADVIVYSSAIKHDNPEIEEARKHHHTPVIPRAEMLAEIMRMKHSVLVAGAHGKTTTTSMIGTILVSGGLDPTVVIGGKLRGWGSNAKIGTGDFFIAEADESDGSFLMLSPTIAVVTNIDREHLDYYRDINHIAETFVDFINKVPFYGLAVISIDDISSWGSKEAPEHRISIKQYMRNLIIPCIKRRFVTYGFSEDADIRAEQIRMEGLISRYKLMVHNREIDEVTLKVPGIHNILNSLAAVAVGWELGMTFDEIVKGLSQFSGVDRRFHIKGEVCKITVVDDYGHHPEEIRAVMKTLTGCFPERRKVVVFQPHRYSRTKALMDEFNHCFEGSDILVVTEIYGAGEKAVAEVSGKLLSEKVKRSLGQEVIYIPDLDSIPDEVCKIVRPNDVVLTLGAGNIWIVGDRILSRLREN